MSIENFLNYEAYIQLQDRNLEIWGQPCTVYSPERKTALGYEDTDYSQIDKMGSDKVLGNTYHKSQSRIWINFNPNKSVFYRFNFFPEEGEELYIAFLDSESVIHENDYIRTAIPEATSIWGDLILEIRAIRDIGLANVLQRIYFLKPTGNADLHKQLDF